MGRARLIIVIVFSLFCGIYLFFWKLWNIPILLVLALDLKGIINTLKRYNVAMECADVVAFTFAA